MTVLSAKLRARVAGLALVGLLATQQAYAGPLGQPMKSLRGSQTAMQASPLHSKATNSGIIVVGGKNANQRSRLRTGSAVSLNPQPLPPKFGKMGPTGLGNSVSLNPQPLPPKFNSQGRSRFGNSVSLNPQPLPPKFGKMGPSGLGDSVSLNPQPLPPKFNSQGRSRFGNSVSLNPQPLPPKVGSSLPGMLRSTPPTMVAPSFNSASKVMAWPQPIGRSP